MKIFNIHHTSKTKMDGPIITINHLLLLIVRSDGMIERKDKATLEDQMRIGKDIVPGEWNYFKGEPNAVHGKSQEDQ